MYEITTDPIQPDALFEWVRKPHHGAVVTFAGVVRDNADGKRTLRLAYEAYAEMADNMGGHVPDNMLNIQTAQASKDATMAHFALQNFQENDLLLHFQGSYHSNYRQGIIWWINKVRPGLDIKSITTVTRSEWEKMTDEEKKTIADYILVVADNMTQTKR